MKVPTLPSYYGKSGSSMKILVQIVQFYFDFTLGSRGKAWIGGHLDSVINLVPIQKIGQVDPPQYAFHNHRDLRMGKLGWVPRGNYLSYDMRRKLVHHNHPLWLMARKYIILDVNRRFWLQFLDKCQPKSSGWQPYWLIYAFSYHESQWASCNGWL
jgi:hypothetical protein